MSKTPGMCLRLFCTYGLCSEGHWPTKMVLPELTNVVSCHPATVVQAGAASGLWAIWSAVQATTLECWTAECFGQQLFRAGVLSGFQLKLHTLSSSMAASALVQLVSHCQPVCSSSLAGLVTGCSLQQHLL